MEKIIEFLLENPIVKWVENTLHLPSPWSCVALYGAIILVLVLVIVLICVGAKNKKAKKAVKEEAPVVEETKEEVVEEPTPVVEETKEEPAEEPAPVVEETKEEVAEEPKKAPKKVKKEEPAPVVEEAKKPTSRMQGKYVLVQEGPNWRYKLKASNGEVIIVSEPYTSEKAVRNGIETLKKNVDVSRCDIIEDKHGLFSFRVITKQGRCLATSANYKTKARAESASESYKRWALSDTIILDDAGTTDHNEVEKIEVEIKEEHNGKFVIKEEFPGYVYQLVATNGRVIATSNRYKSKESCLDACEKFRICVYDGSFYVYKDKNSKFQFKLYNKQNRLVLAGEVYADRSRAISVIESIKKHAKYAVVVDNVIETTPEEVNA
jgi:uncharacterized protein YegP (UPF0339 family)/Sec-independent protein translocase protein TatA